MKCLYCEFEELEEEGYYPNGRRDGSLLMKCVRCGMRMSLFRLTKIKS